MIFGLLRKINTAQPVRQGGLWDVYDPKLAPMLSRVARFSITTKRQGCLLPAEGAAIAALSIVSMFSLLIESAV
jgi:hypothetical protein